MLRRLLAHQRILRLASQLSGSRGPRDNRGHRCRVNREPLFHRERRDNRLLECRRERPEPQACLRQDQALRPR